MFHTFAPDQLRNAGRDGCNPLAGIEVFHTPVCATIRTACVCCNPLAGIEVFHTLERRGYDCEAEVYEL